MSLLNKQSNILLQPSKRIDTIDALRGMALIGITLRHFLSRYNYSGKVYSKNSFLFSVEQVIEKLDYNLLFGKVFLIFVFLFGFSFFLQYDKYQGNFNQYFVKRLFFLLLFAIIDSMFFPGGDILGMYALLGFLMMPLLSLPNKWLIWLAIFLLLEPFQWLNIIYSNINMSWDTIRAESGSLRSQLGYVNENGTLLQNIWVNITKGQLSGLIWSLESGRVTQAFGLMILGFVLGKSGKLKRALSNYKMLMKISVFSIIIACVLFSSLKLFFQDGGITNDQLQLVFSNYLNFFIASAYVAFFVITYKKYISALFTSLKYYGRMSLTHYLIQSVTGGLLFAPFGLNLAKTMPVILISIVCLILITCQVLFSKQWFYRHKYGVIEFYWRKFSITKHKKHFFLHSDNILNT